ncbi:MAG: hypothetical protein GQ574_07350 [Crocinitomix sp.]|nr:hypothetical protein [Crocinitomix sp.]
MKLFKLSLFFCLFLFLATACRKETGPDALDLMKDEMRQPFIGDWKFTMSHYFEGLVYDEVSDTSTYQFVVDTVWVKEGSISADQYSFDGLVVNYGPNEHDFIISTDGSYVTCISDCQNAGYDTLGPFANWWYLAQGESNTDSAAIYNLGVSEYYGSSNSWSIRGYPQ